ncbi:hypothetical protein JMJ35_005883 [Cladonia borealis]|uniref:Uncharacterized protein n=1 Tax=Cladonia borealis TaxID=184061 RepID=A0AA39R062_9LECA|nr:hypothetical protein JMJ35_005883 [Cladonia borealis]
MVNHHMLYASLLAAFEHSVWTATHSVLQRTPSTTTIASPTGRQEGPHAGDSMPSGCERVGIYIRCSADRLSPGSVKALSIPYTNKNNNDNDNGDRTQMRASATPYHNSTTMPAIDRCAKPTGIDRLTCGSPGITIGLFSLLLLSMVLLFMVGWLIFRSANKRKDEENAIEMRPRVNQYQSASKSRLKKEVRCASQADKEIQISIENAVHDLLERYAARSRSIPYEPAWRRERIREKMEELARLLPKELPRGADAFLEGTESTNASSDYRLHRL